MNEKINVKDKVDPTIEKPPKVTVQVRCNGQLHEIELDFDKPTNIKWAGRTIPPVQIKVVDIEKQKPLPVDGPPYKYVIDYTSVPLQRGVLEKFKPRQTVIRAMTEENAKRIFWRNMEPLIDSRLITIKNIAPLIST